VDLSAGDPGRDMITIVPGNQGFFVDHVALPASGEAVKVFPPRIEHSEAKLNLPFSGNVSSSEVASTVLTTLRKRSDGGLVRRWGYFNYGRESNGWVGLVRRGDFDPAWLRTAGTCPFFLNPNGSKCRDPTPEEFQVATNTVGSSGKLKDYPFLSMPWWQVEHYGLVSQVDDEADKKLGVEIYKLWNDDMVRTNGTKWRGGLIPVPSSSSVAVVKPSFVASASNIMV